MSVFSNDEDVGVSSDDIDQIKSNGISKTGTTSPEASSTTSDSPTPTNSVHEKNWSSHWQSLVCEEQRQLLGTEEESSDRQSDGEVEGEVWEITPEQREYYKAQFISLQPDSYGLLPGHIARAFFEKSRLPVTELRKIWQLSDVSKDGALSLEEFNTAMHLVVLRRNQILIPDVLPPPLIPASQASPHRGKQWTKFVESPTSSISSPGPKPVNFDFHKAAVEQDPKILHPVALRLTPGPEVDEGAPASEIRPIQRPQPKKHTAPGPGAIPPPPLQSLPDESVLSNKKEPPPPPPPRPYRHHTRSSSLDLTRLGKSSLLNMPPTVPPRISPGTVSPRKQTEKSTSEGEVGFANFAQFTEDQGKHQVSAGAFQVYRKPASDTSEHENWSPAEIPLDVKVEVREAHNAVLRKHCHELQLSLANLREEKTALQTILDQLVSH
ncbi:ralBP1-associated Eps domain-containing protein 2 [Halyomorpha halys]|uniref:ralBP1-associated Eps domain-containing protein 2 n=1 Tax=Halyomorpha halys TaxID=286706 RepID=UPI0006D4D383|nr:ralBP1-associated Eps domain-containing protein 2 [Halyomorpha halys]XP_024220131.1 ralBP1-associated Eps domain-containing protein 2 [Halyomorpha halys]